MDKQMEASSIVEVLPEKYTFPKLAEFPKRVQNNTGLCWAYASLGCVEFKLVQEYPFLDPKRINFSREHMRYSCFDNSKGKEKSWGITPNSKGGPNIKEFRPCIEAYFSRNSGPVYEFAEPTPLDDKLEDRTFEQIEKTPVKTYFVSDFGVVDPERSQEERKNSVKRAVMNHGAVFASIYYDDDYMNSQYYVMPGKKETKNGGRHAVMIVGWDDSIKKSCFAHSAQLKGDGAFLIRDSAIQTTPGMNWNYWISYEDAYLLEVNGYVKSIEPWYDARRLYQNNYFGTYFARDLAGRYDLDCVTFIVNYKRDSDAGREVLKSVLLFNATVETNVDVFLVRSDGTEEALFTELCMDELGYGTYPVQAKSPDGLSREVYLEAEEHEFALKVTYSRKGKCLIPMEMHRSYREQIGGGIQGFSQGEQYILLNNVKEDVSQQQFANGIGRIGIKLIAEPAAGEWQQLKAYADAYEVEDALLSIPHNGKADAPFSITWSAIDEKSGQTVPGIHIIQDTLINETDKEKSFVLQGVFSISGQDLSKYQITRYYYTKLEKARLIIDPVQAPEEGEYQFYVRGTSPYANMVVQVIGMENGNQDSLAQDGTNVILGTGTSDDKGKFDIRCTYLGTGKLSIWAKTEKVISSSQIIEFEKAYTEEEEETGSGGKKKKYYPKNSTGFAQIFKVLVKGGGAAGVGYAAYYIYVNRYTHIRRGMLPDEIPLLNTHIVHLHVDTVLGAEEEPGVIFFEDDMSGIQRIFKSMENSSIEGITFSVPRGTGLIGTADDKSLVKDGKFIMRDAGSGNYLAPVDKLCGGSIRGMQLLAEVPKEETQNFLGFVSICEGGRIENCLCRLQPSEHSSVMQIKDNFSGILGEGIHTAVSGCRFEGSVKSGGNASGIVGNAVMTSISSSYVNAQLEGRSASGIAAFAMNKLDVSGCMTEGSIVASDSAGGICAGFRPFENEEKSCIQNCISQMDIRIQERTKGMVGYAGGIAGIGGSKERGLEIENCLVLGTISCGENSWIGGVAASAKSCTHTVSAQTYLHSGQANAQISIFGDCVTKECLCYNEIEAEEGFYYGDKAVDGQVLARKKTYEDLGWDFASVWDFSESGYPYLRSLSDKLGQWPFPFVRLLGLEEEGRLRLKADIPISFSGIYGKQMSKISFQSCTKNEELMAVRISDALGSAQDGQEFCLNFGMLSEPGIYQFVLQYLREERKHTVSIPVTIE